MEGIKTSVSVDIDKQLLLKFKSICILKETTMSEEVEKMVREWVQKSEGSAAPKPAESTPEGTGAPVEEAQAPGAQAPSSEGKQAPDVSSEAEAPSKTSEMSSEGAAPDTSPMEGEMPSGEATPEKPKKKNKWIPGL